MVLTREEDTKIIKLLRDLNKLMTSVMYGRGLRRCELVRLRVQDVEFESRQIIVRRAKGDKDRVTLLGESVLSELSSHLGLR